jgi:F0F1-type ATP synthase assembly protein I
MNPRHGHDSQTTRRTTGGSIRDTTEFRVGMQMAGLGFQVATEVAAGALLGWLFDRWRGTGSAGLLTGALVGIAVALFSLVRGARKLHRALDREAPLTPPPEGWKEVLDPPDPDETSDQSKDDAPPRANRTH